jgi:hypothetical protein
MKMKTHFAAKAVAAGFLVAILPQAFPIAIGMGLLLFDPFRVRIYGPWNEFSLMIDGSWDWLIFFTRRTSWSRLTRSFTIIRSRGVTYDLQKEILLV